MRKIYPGIFVFIISLFVSISVSGQVVISQVYGGGGNANSNYKNDFIEILNKGTSPVNLAGWSVQYASAAGSSWAVTNLSGTLAPGQYYLVQEAAGTGGLIDLPTPDVTGNINMSGTAGKVALVNSTTPLTGVCPTTVVDFVGFGTTANCFEGTGPTPAPSNINAVLRANNGCTDDNNNQADFAAGLPNPRNTSSPLNSCVACVAPSNQGTALVLTPAITSISGSFTAADPGTTAADNYLVLVSTSATLSQTPNSGTTYSVGAVIGNAQVVAAGNSTSFTASGLSASTQYHFFVFSYTSTGTCYNIAAPLTGTVSTEANPAPTVSVAAGNNAAEPSTAGSFNITLSAAAPAGGVTINYTLGGTATAGTDYTDPGGSITIAEGQTQGVITIAVVDDNISEAAKTIVITLNSVDNGYLISGASASIALTDDDEAGPISLTNSYSQNFNTLASAGTGNTWLDNSTIPGWYASRVVYNAANGNSNTGALYSFGATGSNERALGSVGSGSTGTVYYGARFVNHTGGPITSIKITYTGEQWRNGGNAAAQTVNLAYQQGSNLTSLTTGTWTAVPNLNFISPVTGASAATLDGNAIGTNAIIVSYTINGLSIASNDEIFIRWEDIDHSGADHGLGIDDFTIEANPADLVAPVVVSFAPANNTTDVSTNTAATFTFDEAVSKLTGSIYIKRTTDNSTFRTLAVTDAAVVLNGTSVTFALNGLEANTSYYVEIDAGSFEDLAGNDFAGVSGASTWTFTTGTNFYTANFNTCTTGITDGFTSFSQTGAITWACTTFGRDPSAPAGTAPFPNGVQINGFASGTNVPNIDWLISPSFDLTGTTYPLLSFWSRTAFNGLPLQLKVSTDYTGGDPALATWTDINGKFPLQTSNIWTLSADINLAAFKQSNVHFAFVYASTDDDGARWTLDDISIANSPVPPPPSLTVNTSDIQFTYVAAGNNASKTFTFTGNDLTGDITLTSTGEFQLSKTGGAYSSSVTFTQAEANNVTQTVYVRFAPTQNNQDYTGSITIATGSLNATVNTHGTSIDPVTTLEVVNWNIEWFGSTAEGPTNEPQQLQNVKTILQSINADAYAFVEIVDEGALANLVSQMPGYGYVLSNYGSHTNPFSSTAGPLSASQKMAFVYKTSVITNVTSEALLSVGINTAADLSNPNYNYWASGRFPYMVTGDVTLNCVTKKVRFIIVHAKANTSPTATSYERRKNGADELYNKLMQEYPDDNIVILGDFNDDLDQSITAGFTTTSWNKFTEDPANFTPVTLPLSIAGKKSTVAYNDIIDHVIVSNELQGYYMNASASILNDVTSLVSNYGSTTSDHYPVFTRYRFSNTTAPVVTTCPTVAPLCVNTENTYSIPAFVATDDCDAVTYSYTITGATTRSGNTNDASGVFNIGTSTITWTAVDGWGNSVNCSTTVVVHPSPAVMIADAQALPSGTAPNTVYIGYAPASSLTLIATPANGTAPYTYAWSNNATGANTTVSPAVNTTYTVTVTDANGCQAQASKAITVKDVRGGNNKVVICHKPNAQNNTLTIGHNDVASHLAHGDNLGSCNTVSFPELTMQVSPNPSINYFNVTPRGGNPSAQINLKVYNVLGKVIEQKQNVTPNQTIRLGQQYQTGIYFIEISQASDRAISTVLKIKF